MRRAPTQLPRGKHGLGREYVVRNQRRRILSAVGSTLSELGYHGTTVEIVRARAGISRRTFYDHFANKEDVVVAYLVGATSRLLRVVDRALREPHADVGLRVEAAVAAVVELVVADPVAAQVWLTPPPGRCSERMVAQRDAAMSALERRLDETTRVAGRRPSAEGLTIAIGGCCEVIRTRIVSGTVEDLVRDGRDLATWLGGPWS